MNENVRNAAREIYTISGDRALRPWSPSWMFFFASFAPLREGFYDQKRFVRLLRNVDVQMDT
jgi:hypothetical protein